MGSSIYSKSPISVYIYTSYGYHTTPPIITTALIPPLFLTACFETGYVMHKHRSVKYLGINFDVRFFS